MRSSVITKGVLATGVFFLVNVFLLLSIKGFHSSTNKHEIVGLGFLFTTVWFTNDSSLGVIRWKASRRKETRDQKGTACKILIHWSVGDDVFSFPVGRQCDIAHRRFCLQSTACTSEAHWSTPSVCQCSVCMLALKVFLYLSRIRKDPQTNPIIVSLDCNDAGTLQIAKNFSEQIKTIIEVPLNHFIATYETLFCLAAWSGSSEGSPYWSKVIWILSDSTALRLLVESRSQCFELRGNDNYRGWVDSSAIEIWKSSSISFE